MAGPPNRSVPKLLRVLSNLTAQRNSLDFDFRTSIRLHALVLTDTFTTAITIPSYKVFPLEQSPTSTHDVTSATNGNLVCRAISCNNSLAPTGNKTNLLRRGADHTLRQTSRTSGTTVS